MVISKIKNLITCVDGTPAFIYDEKSIQHSLEILHISRIHSYCKLLFSLKSFAVVDALLLMAPHLDGFSVSSLFEAKLAREVIGSTGTVHMVTPGYKPNEIQQITEIADHISLNSLSQWERFYSKEAGHASYGLRINPQLSFVEDSRYNPCRKHSKLGVPINQLQKALDKDNHLYTEIEGIHFHTNSNSETYHPLLETVKHLDRQIPRLLKSISWINLGGGYLFNDADNRDLYEAIRLLREKYNLNVFIEPGQGVIEGTGYIVSSVIDIFESDGRHISVLDTTVNHMPEVFEYQYRPDISQESFNGKYEYILAGSTCLAGDIFGTYNFDKPLELGTRIVFEYMGAYTLVKAHMFNGVNLPSIYALTQNGKLELKKQFGYEDFLTRCGVTKNVLV
jgi:carboxynorspermidine decarboxylase